MLSALSSYFKEVTTKYGFQKCTLEELLESWELLKKCAKLFNEAPIFSSSPLTELLKKFVATYNWSLEVACLVLEVILQEKKQKKQSEELTKTSNQNVPVELKDTPVQPTSDSESEFKLWIG